MTRIQGRLHFVENPYISHGVTRVIIKITVDPCKDDSCIYSVCKLIEIYFSVRIISIE